MIDEIAELEKKYPFMRKVKPKVSVKGETLALSRADIINQTSSRAEVAERLGIALNDSIAESAVEILMKNITKPEITYSQQGENITFTEKSVKEFLAWEKTQIKEGHQQIDNWEKWIKDKEIK